MSKLEKRRTGETEEATSQHSVTVVLFFPVSTERDWLVQCLITWDCFETVQDSAFVARKPLPVYGFLHWVLCIFFAIPQFSHTRNRGTIGHKHLGNHGVHCEFRMEYEAGRVFLHPDSLEKQLASPSFLKSLPLVSSIVSSKKREQNRNTLI